MWYMVAWSLVHIELEWSSSVQSAVISHVILLVAIGNINSKVASPKGLNRAVIVWHALSHESKYYCCITIMIWDYDIGMFTFSLKLQTVKHINETLPLWLLLNICWEAQPCAKYLCLALVILIYMMYDKYQLHTVNRILRMVIYIQPLK